MKKLSVFLAFLTLSLNAFTYDGTQIKASEITDQQIEKMIDKAGFYHGLHRGGNPIKFSEITAINDSRLGASILRKLDKKAIHLYREVEFYNHQLKQTNHCNVHLRISKVSKVQNLATVTVSDCQVAFSTSSLEVTLILNGKQ